jgi:hypothetical protein
MTEGYGLEVAEFLEGLSRNWFIRHSLMFSAFSGIFGGLCSFAIYYVGLQGSSIVGWIFALVSIFVFAFSMFLFGIHYVVSRMYMKLLGRNFDYLCDPQEYIDRG